MANVVRAPLPPDLRTGPFVEKMLGRPEQPLPVSPAFWRDKRVLVTGGGGFIGSEICRVLQGTGARGIVAVDRNELGLAALLRSVPGSVPEVLIELADLSDTGHACEILAKHQPDVVIHTAAFKHLPLLERFPLEAFEANALLTAQWCDLAEQRGVSRFVLVSTDKAVAPTSILGASKRMAELLVKQHCESHVQFTAIRCGNVLGSTGSAITVWLEQLTAGHPITISNRAAERYFFAVREVSNAILAVAAQDRPGLFGYMRFCPTRIADLASRFLAEFGCTLPEHAIVTGLEPGEKLRESFYAPHETVLPTAADGIFQIEEAHASEALLAQVPEVVAAVRAACRERNADQLLAAASQLIPEFACPVAG